MTGWRPSAPAARPVVEARMRRWRADDLVRGKWITRRRQAGRSGRRGTIAEHWQATVTEAIGSDSLLDMDALAPTKGHASVAAVSPCRHASRYGAAAKPVVVYAHELVYVQTSDGETARGSGIEQLGSSRYGPVVGSADRSR